MSAGRVLRRYPGRGPGGARFAHECLERVARILVQTGHSPQGLWRELRDICLKLKEPRETWDPARLTDITELTQIITHWHMDDRFVDGQGRPRSLPLHKPEPSLATLIGRVLPGRDPVSAVESLMRLKGVSRSKGGLYVPTARYLELSDSNARVHCLNSLLGMLRTVEHNVSGKGSYRMFERVVTNLGVPRSALPAFHRRLEPRAMNFLVPIDRELHSRKIAQARGPKVSLGVGVFVFESPVRRKPSGRKKAAEPGRDRLARHRALEKRGGR